MARPLPRIEFIGLIKNRSFRALTHQEVRNTMGKVGLREAHNAHFIMRLLERGPGNTLNDLADSLNNGIVQAGEQPGTTDIILRGGRTKVLLNPAAEFVRFTHVRSSG
jgi:hypothetical protein